MRPNGDKKRRKSPERRRTSSLSKTATSATSSTNNGVSTTTVSVGTETGPPSQRNSFYDAREYTPPPLTVAPLASAGMLVDMIKDSFITIDKAVNGMIYLIGVTFRKKTFSPLTVKRGTTVKGVAF